jgi:hypothetical protein
MPAGGSRDPVLRDSVATPEASRWGRRPLVNIASAPARADDDEVRQCCRPFTSVVGARDSRGLTPEDCEGNEIREGGRSIAVDPIPVKADQEIEHPERCAICHKHRRDGLLTATAELDIDPSWPLASRYPVSSAAAQTRTLPSSLDLGRLPLLGCTED